MFTIICTSRNMATNALNKYNPDSVISIVDNKHSPLLNVSGCINYHVIEFHDVVTLDENYPKDRYNAPSPKHIKEIVRIARFLDEHEKLLVHCHAGQSRSPAAALIIVAARFPQYLEFFAQHFRNEAPWIKPNPRMIHIADEVLNLDGKLIKALQDMPPPSMRGGLSSAVVSLPNS